MHSIRWGICIRWHEIARCGQGPIDSFEGWGEWRWIRILKGTYQKYSNGSWSLRPASCYGGKADEAAEASRSLEASLVARRVVLMDLGKQTSKESTGLTASCHNYTHLSWPQNVIWDKMNLQKIAWKFGLVKYDSLFQIFSGDDRNDNDPCVEARCLKIRGHRCIWQNIPGWISMNFVHQPKEWTSLIFNTEAFSFVQEIVRCLLLCSFYWRDIEKAIQVNGNSMWTGNMGRRGWNTKF